MEFIYYSFRIKLEENEKGKRKADTESNGNMDKGDD